MTIAATRTLALLERLASSSEPMTLSGLAGAAGMRRVTVARLGASLEGAGYAVRDGAGRFAISRRLWGLATAVVNADRSDPWHCR